MSLSWLDLYRPASFRGVPFYVEASERTGGRRLSVIELLDNDDASTDDLGGAERRFPVTAYLIGDAYQTSRDALLKALEGQAGAATLIHPYYGNLTARAGIFRVREERERGGYCAIEIEFVSTGAAPAARGTTDTSSSLLSGLVKLLPVIQQAYAIGTLIADRPSVLVGFAEGLLTNAAGNFLGLPTGTLSGLLNTVVGWAGSASDPASTAELVSDAFDNAASNVVSTSQDLATAASAGDAISGNVPLLAPSSDLTGGMEALTLWGEALPPVLALSASYGAADGYTGYVGPTDPTLAPAGVAPLAVQQAVTQQALVDLITGSAVAAVATIYAQTDFPTADAADAAALSIGDLIDDRITAAAYAGADGLYRAWSIVQGLVVADLTQRAQTLPRRTTYSLPRSLPSLVLAQRLYADPTRADELVALNDVSHPGFMPAQGICLTA